MFPPSIADTTFKDRNSHSVCLKTSAELINSLNVIVLTSICTNVMYCIDIGNEPTWAAPYWKFHHTLFPIMGWPRVVYSSYFTVPNND